MNHRVRIRFGPLAALLALIVPVSAPAADILREQSEMVLAPTGWKVLEVENARGSIDVRRSPDARVRIAALKTVHCPDRARSTQIARRIEVTTDRVGDRFLVAVHYPRRSEVRIGLWDMMAGIEYPRSEVRLEIAAPEGMAIRLRSSSGDLATYDRAGSQTLETTSGDIAVRTARGFVDATTTSGDVSAVEVGPVRIHSVSGDITVTGSHGPVGARATSGEIEIRGATDSVRVATVNGDIRVEAAPRGLTAETVSGEIEAHEIAGLARLGSSSGDIRFDLAPRLARAEASSQSGDIRARLAGGLACNLELRTASGTIDVGVPLSLSMVDRHVVTGRVAGGGAPVALRTSSGDIDVVSGGR